MWCSGTYSELGAYVTNNFASTCAHPFSKEVEPHGQHDGEQQQHGDDPGPKCAGFVYQVRLVGVSHLHIKTSR